MKITSPAFENEGTIPNKYTCDGKDMSPPLEFSGVPEGAKSLALVVDDPDAPTKTWVHWMIHGISPSSEGIPEDSTPDDAFEVINDFGKQAYGGPCPPSGSHRYYFRLYALDVSKLKNVNKKNFTKKCKGHVLAEATLMGTYKRSR
ncbi:YbhB/YbcL family Raf kinase inhibitor-like protein [Candidatus Bathyarchaeota archaeon]|nr:YbhB/YbcL family Raf kinase inhibitor-like protein [Candidatus Bathyarchaeota archaeon]